MLNSSIVPYRNWNS